MSALLLRRLRTHHTPTLLLGVLFTLLLSACTAGTVQAPDRPVEITIEEGLAAQDLLVNALATGQVQLTEAQFSSYLTKLLEANTGTNQPVAAITAWFEPETLYLRLTLKDDVLASNFGNTFDLVGGLAVVDGALQIQLDQVGAGPYTVAGATLQSIADQINANLAQQLVGLPLAITLDTGVLTIGIAQ